LASASSLRKYQQRLLPALETYSDYIKFVSCADLDLGRAQAKAAEQGLGKGYSVRELFDDSEVDIVLNLTIPAVHAAVNRQALKAGKHAYTEKPFASSYHEGLKILKRPRN